MERGCQTRSPVDFLWGGARQSRRERRPAGAPCRGCRLSARAWSTSAEDRPEAARSDRKPDPRAERRRERNKGTEDEGEEALEEQRDERKSVRGSRRGGTREPGLRRAYQIDLISAVAPLSLHSGGHGGLEGGKRGRKGLRTLDQAG